MDVSIFEGSAMSRSPPVNNPKKVEANRQNRRDLILAKSAELFSSYGYNATSTEMISEATTLNKGTIYYYYASKAEILYDICLGSAEASLEVLQKSWSESAAENLESVVVGLIEWEESRHAEVFVYFHEEYILDSVLSKDQVESLKKIQRTFMKYFYELIRRGVTRGEFIQVEVKTTARLLVGMIVGSRRWTSGPQASKQVAAAILDLLSQGLIKNGVGTKGRKALSR